LSINNVSCDFAFDFTRVFIQKKFNELGISEEDIQKISGFIKNFSQNKELKLANEEEISHSEKNRIKENKELRLANEINIKCLFIDSNKLPNLLDEKRYINNYPHQLDSEAEYLYFIYNILSSMNNNYHLNIL